MPPLPKKNNRKEAKIDSLVGEWFHKNYPNSWAVEVKVGKNKVLPHQDLALTKVQNNEFWWKIPDMGRKNPFDLFGLKNADAFVVTCDGMKCTAVGRNGDTFSFHL
jgi:hypothetical protein